jgi:hypothetical protein
MHWDWSGLDKSAATVANDSANDALIALIGTEIAS